MLVGLSIVLRSMKEVGDSHVSVRFFGEELDPDEVTESLGITPTNVHRQGERHIGRAGGSRRWPTAHWSLTSHLPASAPLEDHLDALLDRLNVPAVRSLSVKGWRLDFLCSCFLDDWNQGTTLSPDVLARLTALGAALVLDLHSFDPTPADMPQQLEERRRPRS